MGVIPKISESLQRRWLRGVVITVLYFGLLVVLGALLGGDCLFSLNGSKTILTGELIIWLWLLLLFVFAARGWSRWVIGTLALLVPFAMPVCVLVVPGVVSVGAYLQGSALTLQGGKAGPAHGFPASMPPSQIPTYAARNYQFRYVAFGPHPGPPYDHFRIEAVRRHCWCRAQRNLTITDDGIVYFTYENRAATPSDPIFYRVPNWR